MINQIESSKFKTRLYQYCHLLSTLTSGIAHTIVFLSWKKSHWANGDICIFAISLFPFFVISKFVFHVFFSNGAVYFSSGTKSNNFTRFCCSNTFFFLFLFTFHDWDEKREGKTKGLKKMCKGRKNKIIFPLFFSILANNSYAINKAVYTAIYTDPQSWTVGQGQLSKKPLIFWKSYQPTDPWTNRLTDRPTPQVLKLRVRD